MEILIIETETYLASSLASKLENEGHICSIRTPNAAGGGEYDVVLLGGFFDTLKIIKEHPNSVIILLANYINSDISKALKAGASDYILKPIIIEELLRKVEFHSLFKRLKEQNNSFSSILDAQAKKYNFNEKDITKLRLPLQIWSFKEEQSDVFVYLLAKIKSESFVRVKDDLSVLKNNTQIVYFYAFDALSKDDQDRILASKNRKIIIRSQKTIAGYQKYSVTADTYTNVMQIDEYIQFCINEYQDSCNDTELAQILGISRKSLWEKRRRYGITRKK